MEFRIKKAEFVTSVGKDGKYPEKTRAEVAIVGKSNVGKSSLINSLCGMNKLAKTSQKPGKTMPPRASIDARSESGMTASGSSWPTRSAIFP